MRVGLAGWTALVFAGTLPALAVAQGGRGVPAADRAATAGGAAAAERREAIAERLQERRRQALGRGEATPGDRLTGAQDGRRVLDPEQRKVLEQRLRERFGEVVRRQLALTDDQFRRLGETNRQFEGQRRALVQRERATRAALRDELAKGDGGDEARVGERMQELLAIQRERLALTEAEDRQLAEFLTAPQRARYFGLQEQLRRRVDEMRRRAMLAEPLPPG